jgi:hypothetical protein
MPPGEARESIPRSGDSGHLLRGLMWERVEAGCAAHLRRNQSPCVAVLPAPLTRARREPNMAGTEMLAGRATRRRYGVKPFPFVVSLVMLIACEGSPRSGGSETASPSPAPAFSNEDKESGREPH